MTKTNKKLDYSTRVQAWKTAHPRVTRGTRLTQNDRDEAADIARRGKEVSQTAAKTAKRLGVSATALCRWMKSPSGAIEDVSKTPLVPLRFTKHHPRSFIKLTLPSGARVTGVTVADAAELLRAIS